jgi:hypothetical protein
MSEAFQHVRIGSAFHGVSEGHRMKRIHKRNLPPPPKRVKDLLTRPFRKEFEAAQQLVMTASIFKSALDKATAAKENLTPKQLSLLKAKPDDYAMKVYHQFRKEKEVGAVSVAASRILYSSSVGLVSPSISMLIRFP